MLRILLAPAVCIASVAFVAVAFGQIPRSETSKPPATLAYKAQQQPVARKTVLRPLILPNVQQELRKLQSADRMVAVRQKVLSGNVLRFWRNHRWILAPRHEKCWQVPWQRSCTAARASLRLHQALSRRATYLANRMLPYTADWVTAVRIVQRIYPSTESWLLSCSAGEGGHGGFVMNHQGSGASGWLQFMSGTFYGHAPSAFAHVRSLGFILPESLSIRIDSPMAQAITGAYMRTHGMSSHWDPGIDPLCR